MKKTLKELFKADNIVAILYKIDPTLRESKFGYAWKRFYEKNIAPSIKEIEEKAEDARIDNALEDPKTKELLKDGNGYKYSKDGMKNLTEKIRALNTTYNEKEIEIESFISSYVPEMTEEQKEVLTGLVI